MAPPVSRLDARAAIITPWLESSSAPRARSLAAMSAAAAMTGSEAGAVWAPAVATAARVAASVMSVPARYACTGNPGSAALTVLRR